jgi:hypothetical protein
VKSITIVSAELYLELNDRLTVATERILGQSSRHNVGRLPIELMIIITDGINLSSIRGYGLAV